MGNQANLKSPTTPARSSSNHNARPGGHEGSHINNR
nr:MAG TPA: hypothetical protein [Caudoviricetes sp.]